MRFRDRHESSKTTNTKDDCSPEWRDATKTDQMLTPQEDAAELKPICMRLQDESMRQMGASLAHGRDERYEGRSAAKVSCHIHLIPRYDIGLLLPIPLMHIFESSNCRTRID